MDDRNKLIEKLGELSAKAYMFGRMYHIDEVTELTKDINELIAKVFDYSPWHTGTPTEEGLYIVYNKHLCYDIVEVKPWTVLHDVVAYMPFDAYVKLEGEE